MTSYINLLTIDHPKMASDKRRLTSDIFAILAKALIDAKIELDVDVMHSESISKLRARSGFSRLHRPLDEKTGLECIDSRPVKISIGACLSYAHQNPMQIYEEVLN